MHHDRAYWDRRGSHPTLDPTPCATSRGRSVKPASLPPDEEARLVELRSYRILDTPPEAEFDDLVHLAAQICGTPIAFLNLLDERRQWAKARVGIEACEVPRDYSFCSYTVLDPRRPFVIRDTLLDERFSDNPMVVGEPHIRFYAGAPLTSHLGHALGTLSVLDLVPRDLRPEQTDALQRLARQATALLELRRAGGELRRVMAVRRRLEQTLRRTSRELQTILQTVPDIVYVLDRDGRLRRWNREAERATGLTADELRMRPALTLFPEAERHTVAAAIQDVLVNGRSEVEATLLCSDGSSSPYWFTGRALRDERGNAVGLTGVGRDMSAHKEAEEESRRHREHLTRLARKLQSANHELETFAYTVSHDLRAPLRGVEALSDALLSDYAPLLDDDGVNMVERIQAAAMRMAELIEDILRLSRSSYDPLRCEPVDLSALAHEVVAELRSREPREDVRVDVQPGMRVVGDPHLLRIVLENLVGNAWKYTSRTPSARVWLTCRDEGSGVACTVRDNGPGFDQSQARRLFQPFERLHGDQFQGSGIGLATVRRIVSRHGGQVWAEGERGVGAAFHFTLPHVPAARLPSDGAFSASSAAGRS